ncbi:MAG: hypothetical protein ACRD21_07700 [Vicinamibacteria bacterium]
MFAVIQHSRRLRMAAIALLAVAVIGAALGFGIAQIIAMEAMATARALQSSVSDPMQLPDGNAPGASAGSRQVTFTDPIFPPVVNDDPPVASPVQPGQ